MQFPIWELIFSGRVTSYEKKTASTVGYIYAECLQLSGFINKKPLSIWEIQSIPQRLLIQKKAINEMKIDDINPKRMGRDKWM